MSKADETAMKYLDLIRYYHLEVKMSFAGAIKKAQEDIKKAAAFKRKFKG